MTRTQPTEHGGRASEEGGPGGPSVVPPAPPDRGAWGVPWRTERRFRDLVEQVPVVVYVDGVGPDAPLEFIGSRIEGLLGYPVEDWLADPHLWRDRVHPDDRDRVGAAFDSSGRTGRSFTIEYRMVARDGRCVWVRDECALVRNPDGSPRCWQGVLRDISEERRVREEQRELLTALESERRFRDALDRVDLVAATLDASGRVRYCNRTLLRLTGWRMEEVLARSWWDTFVPEEEAGERVGFLQDVRVGNLPPRSERPILTRSKERRLVSWSSVVDRDGTGAVIGVTMIGQDVTEVREGEARLRDAERRSRTLVEQMPAIVFIDSLGEPGTTLYVSPQIERVLGYSVDEWLADPSLWEERLHAEDRGRVLAASSDADATGGPFREEYRLLARDDAVVWVHEETVLVRDDDGRPLYWQGVMLDITQRMEAEEQLRRAEVRYQTLVENMPAISYVQRLDVDADAFYMSPQVEAILGYPPARFRDARFWDDHLHPLDRERALAEDRRTDETHEDYEMEYRMIAADGRTVWIKDEAVLVRDGEGEPWFWQGFMIDITEVKRAEEELRRALSMEREVVGRLRALDEMKNAFLTAVSHELRTPLSVILGTATMLRSHEADPTLSDRERMELLDALVHRARQLDALLADLLDVDRLARGVVEPRRHRTDVAELIGRVIDQTPSGGRVVRRPRAAVWANVDEAMVERIVENLVSNAIRHTPRDARIWARAGRRDGGVLITVDDDGPGVAPRDRERIFEPFRQGPAAQPHSPGVGIGLSLVARFAELHGGSACVRERRGGGASFRVFLPDGPTGGEPTSLV